MATHITPETNLGLYHREYLKAQFKADIAAGTARPLVVPLDLFGIFLIPLIYLCIPHTRRPWLYRMRFAVVALMAWLNWNMMARASSTNMAAAYATGLAAAWGTLWGMTLLIWTRPQFEAERVERRVRRGAAESNGSASGENPVANGALRQRHTTSAPSKSQETTEPPSQSAAPDETVATALSSGYEYYWQSYPSTGPLSTRLNWALDHITSFRGPGWTTGISSIPSFRHPSKPQSESPVDLSSIPPRTKTGYARCSTRRSFLRNRLGRMALACALLDICTVLMLRDPYFILGPDYAPHPLPSYLSPLPPALLSITRSLTALTAIIAALYPFFVLDQVLHFLLSHSHPSLLRLSGARADLWQYPDVFGSFATNVLDHGLAGFWGGWWHQTFRGAFVAPTNWMVRQGYLPRDRRHPLTKLVGAAVAFGQSGVLHAAGSYTALSRTARPWSPPVFFLGSLGGVLVQAGWDAVVGRGVRRRCPRWVRRGANLGFVVVWLHVTGGWFVDDLCRAGVWLYEPLPFSPLRALGMGLPGDGAWRWDGDVMPRLWVGRRWWESGIAL
ncbi:hypothetical protein CONLIGDRAFT_688336 [Coniochaeta ligniaria NRRL 30616]|uniref:Wax synthase domain-containing protein n=1 Tax=Coniochaeta ligniaria NRRL 30616 TaxID=1408157 RepID=A0A1J7J4U7_9PEZI|nr:hypothetical protein CONLIGDRAFT_688336 [Coniochaeta ligniaria NRRL 30616]